jgi:methionine synthase II (cobalamin-independent)
LAKTKAFKTSDPAKQEKIKKLIEALSQEIKETSEKIVELLMSDETLLAEALE